MVTSNNFKTETPFRNFRIGRMPVVPGHILNPGPVAFSQFATTNGRGSCDTLPFGVVTKLETKKKSMQSIVDI